jgi:hypothetical protein
MVVLLVVTNYIVMVEMGFLEVVEAVDVEYLIVYNMVIL